ncbi:CVNH domain-containing [Fusarium albosuccineum]|uniref:CVNH domain-containing n=2 Tax=Fusarium decemcellulare species complex TaxID=1329916 RepID=A0A8H4LIS8_9HYPO|nr:CVNH domain-containing [Fusarium albosuccineum]KAJ3537927.1 hypothetical protein NM208_g6119 [Fusarium decemcellulare]
MKFLVTFSALLPLAVAADWGQSCKDEVLDPATNIITASCNSGDGKGTFVDAELDLDECLGYADGKIFWKKDGNFGEHCKDCTEYRLPDEVWGGLGATRPWLECTCEGVSEPVKYNLDITLITNVYGELVCTR